LPATHWAGIDCGCGVRFSFQDSHGSESWKACRQKSSLWAPGVVRQTEVAHLVGKGLSNPEVAAELFISRKAVEYHLGNIYEIRHLFRTGAFDDPGICLRGVHVHVGSPLSGVQAWTDGARAALRIWAEPDRTGPRAAPLRPPD
jgi:Bacterial regulatory proteins, luxR family